MEETTVEDLMIPLNEYATVYENAGLLDAIDELEKIQKKVTKSMIPHRAVLVHDDSNHIVGKISQFDILKALESNSQQINHLKKISKYGFSQDAIRAMIAQQNLWESLEEKLNRKAKTMRVKDFMYKPSKEEVVQRQASLNEAIHQMVVGHHHSLLVVFEKKIIGILRLVDVFDVICHLSIATPEPCDQPF
jgi:CBS domain-containing protein